MWWYAPNSFLGLQPNEGGQLTRSSQTYTNMNTGKDWLAHVGGRGNSVSVRLSRFPGCNGCWWLRSASFQRGVLKGNSRLCDCVEQSQWPEKGIVNKALGQICQIESVFCAWFHCSCRASKEEAQERFKKCAAALNMFFWSGIWTKIFGQLLHLVPFSLQTAVFLLNYFLLLQGRIQIVWKTYLGSGWHIISDSSVWQTLVCRGPSLQFRSNSCCRPADSDWPSSTQNSLASRCIQMGLG